MSNALRNQRAVVLMCAYGAGWRHGTAHDQKDPAFASGARGTDDEMNTAYECGYDAGSAAQERALRYAVRRYSIPAAQVVRRIP